MKSTGVLLVSALVCAPACSGRTSLDTWEEGIPAYLQGGGPVSVDGGTDGGTDGGRDATTGNDSGEPMGGAVGDPCSSDGECQGGSATCLESVTFAGFVPVDFPGGYCTVPDCQDDADCPKGSACFDIAGNAGCNKLCESDGDCRQAEGYSCASIPFSSDTRTSCQPEVDLGGPGF